MTINLPIVHGVIFQASTMASVDASNSCIPPSSPLVISVPPLPSTTRGEPSVFDGRCGRINAETRSLLYASGRLVICRNLTDDTAFCYRGHTSPVTAASFSPSGCYVASADTRGKLRVWSYDNEEHLAKIGKTIPFAGYVVCFTCVLSANATSHIILPYFRLDCSQWSYSRSFLGRG